MLLALGLLCLVAAERISAQSVADHVTMGAEARQAGDLHTALAHYEAALDLDSTDHAANWRAALVLLDMGEQIPDGLKSPERDSLYARAEILAHRAVAADSTDAEGHFALAAAVGRASLTKGKKQRIRRAPVIRDEARKAIALDPRHDGAYHILGRWNAEIMRLSGFNRFFAKSFLGADIFKEASWDSATADLEKAVELDPRRIYHRLELAEVYVDRKRYDDARRELAALDSLPFRELRDSAYKAEGDALAKRIADKH